MNRLVTAAAAGILAAALSPAPASASPMEGDVCNPESSAFDLGACEQLMQPMEDYENEMNQCDPATGLDGWGVPCGGGKPDLDAAEQDRLYNCSITDPSLYGQVNCERHEMGTALTPEEPATPEPVPEPAYEAPTPDAEHLGGNAWWHENAQTIACGSSAAGR